MRVVLSFATSVEWHEGHAIARALVRLGYLVRVVDIDTYPADATIEQAFGPETPGLFIYIEPQGLLPRGLERAPCRTVCFLCDTALSLPPRRDLARLFDHVVLYHRDSLSAFTDHDAEAVHWMPFALDPELFADRGLARDFDIGYVGSLDGIWSERRRLLDLLATRHHTNAIGRPVTNQEMAGIYARSRIVFHQPIVDTITPRVFEAMGAGAMLLTGRARNGLDLLFDDGVHLVTFDGEADLLEKAEYYLTHEDARARIALAGHQLVRTRHTWDVRLQGVLEAIRKTANAPARQMRAKDVDDIYQRHYKQRGAVDALVRSGLRSPIYSPRRWSSLANAGATWLKHH